MAANRSKYCRSWAISPASPGPLFWLVMTSSSTLCLKYSGVVSCPTNKTTRWAFAPNQSKEILTCGKLFDEVGSAYLVNDRLHVWSLVGLWAVQQVWVVLRRYPEPGIHANLYNLRVMLPAQSFVIAQLQRAIPTGNMKRVILTCCMVKKTNSPGSYNRNRRRYTFHFPQLCTLHRLIAAGVHSLLLVANIIIISQETKK